MQRRTKKKARLDYGVDVVSSEESGTESDGDLEVGVVLSASDIESDEEWLPHSFQPRPSTSKDLPIRPIIPSSVIVGYLSKDGQTNWNAKAPTPSRTRAHNILQNLHSEPKGPAENSQLSPMEIFKLILTPEIVALTLNYTNKYALETYTRKPAKYPWKPIDETEFYAVVGLLLLSGCNTSSNQPRSSGRQKRTIFTHNFWQH